MWIEMADRKGNRFLVLASERGAVKLIGRSVRMGWEGGAHVTARRWVKSRGCFAKAQVAIALATLHV